MNKYLQVFVGFLLLAGIVAVAITLQNIYGFKKEPVAPVAPSTEKDQNKVDSYNLYGVPNFPL